MTGIELLFYFSRDVLGVEVCIWFYMTGASGVVIVGWI